MKRRDINLIFNQNLKLKKIGTKKEYEKYLKNYFPNSKFKKIVYHHSDEKIEKFKDDFIEGYASRHGVSKRAIFFLENPVGEDFLSKRPHLILSLINVENPLKYRSKFKLGTKESKAHGGIKEGVDYALKNKYDCIIFDKIWDNRTWCKVISVFSSKKIHVLGSKKDEIDFKKFISNKTNLSNL